MSAGRDSIEFMASLTIVGFASGSPLSQLAMARLARDHRLAAIVGPPSRGGVLRKLARKLRGRKNPLAGFGVPLIETAEVGRFKPDLLVVASFPRIIRADVLATARIGALNMHASALPRHRGVDGIFGTYFDDDRDAAMTIHWIDGRIDAGDIAAQQSIPLIRGRPSRELYMELAAIGVELLSGVLEQVSAGKLPRRKQDESNASYRSAADISGTADFVRAVASRAGVACAERPRRPALGACRRCRRAAARTWPRDALPPHRGCRAGSCCGRGSRL